MAPLSCSAWTRENGSGALLDDLEGSQVSISVTIAIAITVMVVVVVVLGIRGELLENSKMGLTLLASSLAVLHNDPKQLGRGRFRWWWWFVATMASSSSCVNHHDIKRV